MSQAQKALEFGKISKLVETGQFGIAKTTILHAMKRYPREFFLNNILGAVFGMQNQWDDSAKYFTKAVKINPKNFEALRNLGNAERNRGNLVAAHRHMIKALKLNPKFPEGWCSLGLIYLEKKDNAKAIEVLNKALMLKPDFDMAAVNLFSILDRTNKLDILHDAVQKFEKAAPDHPVAKLYTGLLLSRNKEDENARKMLESVEFPTDRSHGEKTLELVRLNTLSKTQDKLGNFDAAFSLYERSNSLNAEISQSGDYNAQRYLNSISQRLSYFEPGCSANWLAKADATDAPVFLVGFPRSGTTLLETFLGGHDDISVSDERPLTRMLTDALGTTQKTGMAAMDSATGKHLKKAKFAYFKEMDKYCAKTKVRVDKLPLNLVHAGEILRVFPQAKFILLIRDPADSVLSCFMQSFELNDAMANFETINSAARTYDKVMQLWQAQIAALSPQVFTCHYEELITDNENVMHAMVDFLGLEWQEQILDHQSSAKTRPDVRTPSYLQVVQPLYKSAMQRWRNYEHLMPEALEILRPWRKHFGYSD